MARVRLDVADSHDSMSFLALQVICWDSAYTMVSSSTGLFKVQTSLAQVNLIRFNLYYFGEKSGVNSCSACKARVVQRGSKLLAAKKDFPGRIWFCRHSLRRMPRDIPNQLQKSAKIVRISFILHDKPFISLLPGVTIIISKQNKLPTKRALMP